jgi:YegS/Rv2252/BmrU family lipid kinase
MRSLIIVNPSAGQGKPAGFANEIEAVFRESGRTLVFTNDVGDAERIARDAAASGIYDELLAAGGDGTINEVVNGVLKGQPEFEKRPVIGLISLGSQNVLAQELGLPIGKISELRDVFVRGHYRTIDLGMAGERYFTLMAGFGFDAAVVSDVTRPIKELIGSAAYAFATLGALAKYHSTSVRLVLDNEEIKSEAFLIIVANASMYAYRQIKLAPFASIDDGWLDICVFERAPNDRVGFVTQLLAVLAARHLKDPRVRYYRARSIYIESSPPINGQVDGDVSERTPVKIEVVPKSLKVYAP